MESFCNDDLRHKFFSDSVRAKGLDRGAEACIGLLDSPTFSSFGSLLFIPNIRLLHKSRLKQTSASDPLFKILLKLI